MTTDWSIPAERDQQSVTPDWQSVNVPPIEGVSMQEVKPVITGTGIVLELLRGEWLGPRSGVDQVFLRTLDPGAIAAWHVHESTTDRFFCIGGRARMVLYDARKRSPTHTTVAEHILGIERPTLLIVPPGVVHGVQALGAERVMLINMVDIAYSYDQPDHWRLHTDTPAIPYSFTR